MTGNKKKSFEKREVHNIGRENKIKAQPVWNVYLFTRQYREKKIEEGSGKVSLPDEMPRTCTRFGSSGGVNVGAG